MESQEKVVLSAHKICKDYNGVQVLKNINLKVNKGDFIAVMGPSGSGKSTLLYVLSALEKSSSGNVYIGDIDITNIKEKDIFNVRLNKMGFVFQQINLLKNLNVLDNIVLPGYLNKTNKKDIVNKKAKEYLEIMNIEKIESKEIANISGGEMQRVAIARALINDPDIIFLDEPTGALNSNSALDVLNILNKLNKEGKTLLMVTHDLKIAARADKIIYLTDGTIKDTFELGKYKSDKDKIYREKKVSKYLLEMGW